jgi:hypothetical protein
MFDAAYFADPYPVWGKLRARGPIHYKPPLGWFVLRHGTPADIRRWKALTSENVLRLTREDGPSWRSGVSIL